jgi:hypothetical protein
MNVYTERAENYSYDGVDEKGCHNTDNDSLQHESRIVKPCFCAVHVITVAAIEEARTTSLVHKVDFTEKSNQRELLK